MGRNIQKILVQDKELEQRATSSKMELVQREVEQREEKLYACALEEEKDREINEEMEAWDITMNDGFDP